MDAKQIAVGLYLPTAEKQIDRRLWVAHGRRLFYDATASSAASPPFGRTAPLIIASDWRTGARNDPQHTEHKGRTRA